MAGIDWKEVATAASTLFLILDPLGNIPAFLAILQGTDHRFKTRVIVRELVIALVILTVLLVAGVKILGILGLSRPSLNIAGGVMLFVIALRMVFPSSVAEEALVEDPFIVPLAVPLIAGPSAIAYVLFLSTSYPERILEWLAALFIAWTASLLILAASPAIFHRMGDRALRAITRLMGMLLILVAVQMFLDGTAQYLKETLGLAA